MWKLTTLLLRVRGDLVLAWALLRDQRAPRMAKFVLIAALLYILSPIDLVPDLLPGLGWLDDAVVATLLLQLALHLLPPALQASLKAQVARRRTDRRR